MPVLVSYVDRDQRYRYNNDVYRQWFGTDPDELLGKTVAEVLGEAAYDGLRPLIERALAGERIEFEREVPYAHGGTRRVHATYIPHVQDGAIVGYIGMIADVTARYEEQTRRDFIARARETMTESLDMGATLDALTAVLVPDFADWVGVIAKEADGSLRRVARRISRPDLQPLADADVTIDPDANVGVAVVLREGTPTLYAVIPRNFAEGVVEKDLAVASSTPLRSAMAVPLITDGKVTGAITFGSCTEGRYQHDDLEFAVEFAHHAAVALRNAQLHAELNAALARTQRLASDLQKSNAAKDEFLGLVSHELRTPITTIKGNAQVLHNRWQSLGDADRIEALRDISSESDRLAQIIDNLLFLARSEVGATPEREPVLVIRMVEAVVEQHRRRFPGREIRIEEEGATHPVLCVDGYLRQTIENLLSNAEKYSPRNEPIVARIERGEGRVTLRVLDRGPGIAADERERVFEPFYRSETAQRTASGVGIGLAVCRRLIESQGGTIWASPREGGGSEFGLQLPCDDDAMREGAAPRS